MPLCPQGPEYLIHTTSPLKLGSALIITLAAGGERIAPARPALLYPRPSGIFPTGAHHTIPRRTRRRHTLMGWPRPYKRAMHRLL